MAQIENLKSLFDVVLGVPVHPLVVHFVVVGLPVTALVALYAVAKNRRWWRNLSIAGFLVLGATVVAKQTGEALATRVGYKAIDETGHYRIGSILPLVAVAMFLSILLMWVVDTYFRSGSATLRNILAMFVVVSAFAAIAGTIWAGHTGAEAVWKRIVHSTTYGTYPERND